MKFIRIFLLVLIIIGLGLIVTQKIWVPKLVGMILNEESSQPVDIAQEQYSPSKKYYAVETYLKSEMVACCGSEIPNKLRKYYLVSIYETSSGRLIREFEEFATDGYEGYIPRIKNWYSDNILEMYGNGIIDAFIVYYDISQNKLIPEWEFK